MLCKLQEKNGFNMFIDKTYIQYIGIPYANNECKLQLKIHSEVDRQLNI